MRHAQPEEWSETAPFTRFCGTAGCTVGASDAKGQALAHVWAVRALEAAAGRDAGVNVKLLVEGEEEIGSPNLESLLRDNHERFACDLIVFSDTIQWRDDAPAPVTTMRGTVTATLTVTGPERDVHSGVAAGVTLNPALILAQVLSRFHDESGRIAVPGFYDDVVPLTPERRAEFEALPYDPETWLERTETRVITGEEGFSLKERLWARPVLEVISLLAGDPAGIERSVIPREAKASLSVRTVPGQKIPKVADQLRAFIAVVMPVGAIHEFTVDERIAQEPYSSPDGAVLEALERALARGYGTAVKGRMGNAG